MTLAYLRKNSEKDLTTEEPNEQPEQRKYVRRPIHIPYFTN